MKHRLHLRLILGLALLFSVLAAGSSLLRGTALAGEPPPTEAPWPNGKGPR
jgi:hypothetical protein